jgi:hypothetical protein
MNEAFFLLSFLPSSNAELAPSEGGGKRLKNAERR